MLLKFSYRYLFVFSSLCPVIFMHLYFLKLDHNSDLFKHRGTKPAMYSLFLYFTLVQPKPQRTSTKTILNMSVSHSNNHSSVSKSSGGEVMGVGG